MSGQRKEDANLITVISSQYLGNVEVLKGFKKLKSLSLDIMNPFKFQISEIVVYASYSYLKMKVSIPGISQIISKQTWDSIE